MTSKPSIQEGIEREAGHATHTTENSPSIQEGIESCKHYYGDRGDDVPQVSRKELRDNNIIRVNKDAM